MIIRYEGFIGLYIHVDKCRVDSNASRYSSVTIVDATWAPIKFPSVDRQMHSDKLSTFARISIFTTNFAITRDDSNYNRAVISTGSSMIYQRVSCNEKSLDSRE